MLKTRVIYWPTQFFDICWNLRYLLSRILKFAFPKVLRQTSVSYFPPTCYSHANWSVVWDILVYDLGYPGLWSGCPAPGVGSSCRWGDGVHCKLWPVKLNPRWILVDPTAGVSFQGIYCNQVALFWCLCSAKVKGRRREKDGGLLVKCKHLGRTAE